MALTTAIMPSRQALTRKLPLYFAFGTIFLLVAYREDICVRQYSKPFAENLSVRNATVAKNATLFLSESKLRRSAVHGSSQTTINVPKNTTQRLDVSDPAVYLPRNVSEPYSWQRMDHPRRPLGFLHIPKTGGTSIEKAAAQVGISWGCCLFRQRNPSFICPPDNVERLKQNDTLLRDNKQLAGRYVRGAPWWHVPVQYLPVDSLWSIHNHSFPYTDPYNKQDLFVVIRNPYRRVVSEYYYSNGNRFAKGWKNDTAEQLNKELQQALAKVKAAGKPIPTHPAPIGYFQHDGHYIPMYDFVYDPSSQRRIVQHVIHFEHLNNQFQSLMSSYGLDVNLTAVAKVHDRGRKQTKQTVADLTSETRQLIEEVYEEDFELGGYLMIERSLNQ